MAASVIRDLSSESVYGYSCADVGLKVILDGPSGHACYAGGGLLRCDSVERAGRIGCPGPGGDVRADQGGWRGRRVGRFRRG